MEMAPKKKIIWVEDDSFLSGLVAMKLEHGDFGITLANSSDEMMRELEKEMPAVIVLDLMLPGQDGFEVLKTLKADDRYKMIPVVVVTNLSQESDIQKAKELGAAKFLIKAHSTIDEILKEIETMLS